MKNKKGFTLIELLAVIVILAIIALIATPIILNMIKNARLSAARSSSLGYIDSLTKYAEISSAEAGGLEIKGYEELLPETSGDLINCIYENDTWTDGENTKKCSAFMTAVANKTKGNKPTSANIIMNKSGHIQNGSTMVMNGFLCVYNNNDVVCGKDFKPSGPIYSFGDPTESSTSNYESLKKDMFIKSDNGETSICIAYNSKLSCIKGNDYATAKDDIKETFSSNGYVGSGATFTNGGKSDAFTCEASDSGFVKCYSNSLDSTCVIYEDGKADCCSGKSACQIVDNSKKEVYIKEEGENQFVCTNNSCFIGGNFNEAVSTLKKSFGNYSGGSKNFSGYNNDYSCNLESNGSVVCISNSEKNKCSIAADGDARCCDGTTSTVCPDLTVIDRKVYLDNNSVCIYATKKPTCFTANSFSETVPLARKTLYTCSGSSSQEACSSNDYSCVFTSSGSVVCASKKYQNKCSIAADGDARCCDGTTSTVCPDTTVIDKKVYLDNNSVCIYATKKPTCFTANSFSETVPLARKTLYSCSGSSSQESCNSNDYSCLFTSSGNVVCASKKYQNRCSIDSKGTEKCCDGYSTSICS